jgi:hypothetical protein
MLQQAIVVALFPEHHVQVLEKIPEAEPAAEVDLVIIDSAALCERDSPTAGGVRAVQSWRLPVIFMGAGTIGDKAAPKNSKRLIMPLKRDDLKTAVAESLRLPAQRRASSAEPAPTSSASAVAAKKKASGVEPDGVTSDNGKEVIELTDVIEEIPGYDNSETRGTKPNLCS